MNKVQRKKIIMIKSEKTSMIMIVMITTMMIKMSVMPIKREIKIITNFRKHYKEEKNSYVVTESSRAHHRVVVITKVVITSINVSPSSSKFLFTHHHN